MSLENLFIKDWKIGITFLILSILSFAYFYLARKLGITDNPNVRSSHTETTIRGLGILFPAGVFMWAFFSGFSLPYFLIGIFVLSLISFLDDLYTLPGKYRFAIHIIAVLLVIYEVFGLNIHWFTALGVIFLGVGFINAFNFMDGINGLTGIYGLVSLTSLAWVNISLHFIQPDLLIITGISVLIFLFFNFRRGALAFCGDVGSVSLAGILLFSVLLLIEHSSWKYLLFFTVYGLDTAYTLLYRIQRRERVFDAHRLHFYQLMVHEAHWQHRSVSMLYGVFQIGLNIVLVVTESIGLTIVCNIIVLGFMHTMRRRMGYAIRIAEK